MVPFSVVNADTKIGVVNAVKILEQAPQAEQAIKNLEKEFKPRDRKIISEQTSLKKKEKALLRDGSVMSESKRSRLEREIRSKRRDIKRMKDEFREDFNVRRNEELGKLQKKIQKVINDYAKNNNFDLILSEGVVYTSTRIDISNAILRKLKVLR